MKIKFIAAALIAVFCILLAAGCGEQESSSANSSVTEPTVSEASYSYSFGHTHFNCRTNIEDYINGDSVDMDKLAEATGSQKTNQPNEWTSAANGVRVLVDLAEPKDGVFSAITVTASHMDGTKKNYKLTYTEEKSDNLYKYGENKISGNGIALMTYALENAATADDNDPFAKPFSNYKNDKGEYVLTDK